MESVAAESTVRQEEAGGGSELVDSAAATLESPATGAGLAAAAAVGSGPAADLASVTEEQNAWREVGAALGLGIRRRCRVWRRDRVLEREEENEAIFSNEGFGNEKCWV